jgi:hypothetical protein
MSNNASDILSWASHKAPQYTANLKGIDALRWHSRSAAADLLDHSQHIYPVSTNPITPEDQGTENNIH